MSKTQTSIVLNRMFFFKYPDVDEAILFYFLLFVSQKWGMLYTYRKYIIKAYYSGTFFKIIPKLLSM